MKFTTSACVIAALFGSIPFYCDFLDDRSFDLDMTTPEMIRMEGYRVEEHSVLTEDGYSLTMHRIPGKPGGPTVFVQHGMLSNSFDWVITGKGNGLAFILADYGYDVWLGNARGNTYSNSHVSLDPSDPRYWDFSWHEMGVYDLPAELSYIANLKNDSITYIGHSMGTTMFYVMAIHRPDIAAKIKAMFSFAPVAYMTNCKSPIKYLSSSVLESLNQFFGINQLLPQGRFTRFVNKYICSFIVNKSNLCLEFIYALCGRNSQQFNNTLLPMILSHTPAGTSMKTFYHYLQSHEAGRFQYYDYGTSQNMMIYNSTEPPEYDLSKIQVPIGIFWSNNDYLADPLDVKRFYESIPRKILNYRVRNAGFSHIDYMWAIEAPKLLYSKLLSFMEIHRYSKKEGFVTIRSKKTLDN